MSETAPYSSLEDLPYGHPHTPHLYTVARLFGMQPVDFHHARVLELGCGSGEHLIAQARAHPRARFHGIDPSGQHIAMGQKIIDKLSLKNIRLEEKSFLDFPVGEALFDYLICHGVFSWASEAVQSHILQLCQKNLEPNGIAFISYHTLPGWNLTHAVRDMTRYHTQHFESADKLTQAQALLQLVHENAAAIKTPYGALVKREAEILKSHPDHDWMGVDLDKTSTQFYFHEFMGRAQSHGLQYLGDADVSSMFTGSLPKKAAKILATASDIIRTEQYMDFITDRRSRHTLLCHQGVILNRNLEPDVVEEFYIRSLLTPQEPPAAIDLRMDAQHVFTGPITLVSNNRHTTALFLTLWEQSHRALLLRDIIDLAAEKLENADKTFLRTSFIELGLRAFLAGALQLFSQPRSFAVQTSRTPITLPRTRAQETPFPWTGAYQMLPAELYHRLLLQHMDGKNRLATLTQKLCACIESGELTLQKGGFPIQKASLTRKEIKEIVEDVLSGLMENTLMSA